MPAADQETPMPAIWPSETGREPSFLTGGLMPSKRNPAAPIRRPDRLGPGARFAAAVRSGAHAGLQPGHTQFLCGSAFALVLPAGWGVAAVVIVVQSLVELFGMVFFLGWILRRLFRH